MNPAPADPRSTEKLAAALQRSRAQYRSLVDSMDLGYFLVEVIEDEQGTAVDLKYLEANAKAVTMTGTDLVGRTTRELSPDFEPHWFETFGRVARTGVGERHQLTAAPLGAWYDFYVFKVGEPDARQLVALYQDITQRKQAEAALRASEEHLRQAHDELESRVLHRTVDLAQSNAALEAELLERRAAEEQIKALFARLVSTQEAERRRIALDIHNQLGQQMTALRLNLEVLHLRCDAQSGLADLIVGAGLLAGELDQRVDFLTWQLRPVVLDDLGLEDALEQLITGWSERCRLSAGFEVVGVRPQRFNTDVETNLYHLAEEALHNVYKHAGATRVDVRLEHGDRDSVLVIGDNGCGFDLAEAQRRAAPKGLGLVNMRERAALAGAQLQIESTNQGTVVRAIVRA